MHNLHCSAMLGHTTTLLCPTHLTATLLLIPDISTRCSKHTMHDASQWHPRLLPVPSKGCCYTSVQPLKHQQKASAAATSANKNKHTALVWFTHCTWHARSPPSKQPTDTHETPTDMQTLPLPYKQLQLSCLEEGHGHTVVLQQQTKHTQQQVSDTEHTHAAPHYVKVQHVFSSRHIGVKFGFAQVDQQASCSNSRSLQGTQHICNCSALKKASACPSTP